MWHSARRQGGSKGKRSAVLLPLSLRPPVGSSTVRRNKQRNELPGPVSKRRQSFIMDLNMFMAMISGPFFEIQGNIKFQRTVNQLAMDKPNCTCFHCDDDYNFDDDKAMQLASALETNTRLEEMELCIGELRSPKDPGTLKLLQMIETKCPRLRKLGLKGNGQSSQLADAFYHAIRVRDCITRLVLTNISLGSGKELLPYLRTSTKLSSLFLAKCDLANHPKRLAQALNDNSSISTLFLGALSPRLFQALVEHLDNNKRITSLHVSDPHHALSPALLGACLKRHDQITEFSFGGNHEEAPPLQTLLQHQQQRTTFLLHHCVLNRQATTELALYVRHAVLENLDISNCGLDNANLQLLVDSGLSRQFHLRRLDLSRNSFFGTHAGRSLGSLLRRNKRLKRLDVDRNHLGGACGHLARGLRQHSTLQHLSLASCSIGNQGLIEICQAVTETSVNTLVLSANGISEIGCVKTMLESRHGGMALILNANPIKNAGAIALSQFLGDGLSELYLDSCLIKDEGIVALFDSLGAANNATSLTHLDVESNEFGLQGLQAIIRNLPKLTKMTKLLFSWPRTDGGTLTQALLKSMERNTSIEKIRILDAPFDDDALSFFTNRNRTRPFLAGNDKIMPHLLESVMVNLGPGPARSIVYYCLQERGAEWLATAKGDSKAAADLKKARVAEEDSKPAAATDDAKKPNKKRAVVDSKAALTKDSKPAAAAAARKQMSKPAEAEPSPSRQQQPRLARSKKRSAAEPAGVVAAKRTKGI